MGRTIYLAGLDTAVGDSLSTWIELQGCTVRTYAVDPALFESLAQRCPDSLILDGETPNARARLQTVRTLQPDLNLIVLATRPNASTLRHAARWGAIVIEKPLGAAGLRQLLNVMLSPHSGPVGHTGETR